MESGTVAQSPWVSPGRRYDLCGLLRSMAFAAFDHARTHNLNPLHVKPTVALPDQSGIEALRKSVFLPKQHYIMELV